MAYSAQVILVGAGKGTRMKQDKLFFELLGKPLIYYSIKPFETHKSIEGIVIVAKPEDKKDLENMIREYGFKKIRKIVEGGATRQDSSYEGLKALDKSSIVLIHNVANPLITEKEITNVLKAVNKYGAAAVGYPAKDTIKKVDSRNFVKETLKRKELWQMQTPQGMKYNLAIKAFEQAYKDDYKGTDDVSLAERLGYDVKIVECSRTNIKLTYPEDLRIAEIVLKMREEKK